MEKRLYIAYGSNLDVTQMAFRCPGAKPVAKRWLDNYRLVFQGRSYGAHANIIPAPGKRVPVVIWEIGKKDERQLDIYEGVRGGYYTREFLEVDVNGTHQEALVYIMTPNDFGIPENSYLETIQRGYEFFRIDTRILADAMDYTISAIRKGREQ